MFRISLVKVMIIPPARVRKPLALCDGSWDLSDIPTCTIPNPSSIRPMALMRLKIKVDRLLTVLIGSPAANAVTAPIVAEQTSALYMMSAVRLLFLDLLRSLSSLVFKIISSYVSYMEITSSSESSSYSPSASSTVSS